MENLDLDSPIVRFRERTKNSKGEVEYIEDILTLNKCTQSFHITGTVGSGKSTGSVAFLGACFLRNGFGGLILTAKTEEIDTWRKLFKVAGRKDEDLIVLGEEGPHYRFDPILYQAIDPDANDTLELVNLLMSLSKTSNRISGTAEGSNADPFWENASRRLLTSCISLLKLTPFPLSVDNIDKLIRAADGYVRHKTIGDVTETVEEHNNRPEAFLIDCLTYGTINAVSDEDKLALISAENYLTHDYPHIPERTRGSIRETLYSIISPFITPGVLSKYFTNGLSKEVYPERTFLERKVIIVNLPIKKFFSVGAMGQMIYKRMFQRAIEKRDMSKNDRPVFMVIDEAHYFLEDQDYLFFTTSRSKRCCSILATQSLSNYLATLPGPNAKSKVDALLTSLVTKIVHASNDPESNEYYSRLIGKHYARIADRDQSDDQNEFMDRYAYQVEPTEFAELYTGGKEYNFIVQAYFITVGKWSNGKNFKKFSFDQSLIIKNNT